MEFSRQDYLSGFPCSPPGELPDSGTEPASPALQGDSLRLLDLFKKNKYEENNLFLQCQEKSNKIFKNSSKDKNLKCSQVLTLKFYTQVTHW